MSLRSEKAPGYLSSYVDRMSQPVRILIADDHPIFRKGLASVIEKVPNFEIVGEAEDGEETLKLVQDLDPDILILDIDMPVLDGIAVARQMLNSSSSADVIFLTMHKDGLILRSLKSLDVKGYVLKDSALNEVVECLNTVVNGKTYLSPALNDLIMEAVQNESDTKTYPLLGTLTKSEIRVLKLITESKTNKEIADQLFIAVRTVETHRYNICSKLQLNGAHSLFKFAIQNKDRIRSLTSD